MRLWHCLTAADGSASSHGSASSARLSEPFGKPQMVVVWATKGRAYPLGQLSWSQAIARVACIVGCKRTAYIGSSILSNREWCLLGRWRGS